MSSCYITNVLVHILQTDEYSDWWGFKANMAWGGSWSTILRSTPESLQETCWSKCGPTGFTMVYIQGCNGIWPWSSRHQAGWTWDNIVQASPKESSPQKSCLRLNLVDLVAVLEQFCFSSTMAYGVRLSMVENSCFGNQWRHRSLWLYFEGMVQRCRPITIL